jgi:hypothetical protein
MGFKSFKSYGSRVAIPTIIKVIVPQSSNILMAVGGGAPNVNTNIITSTDNGLTWSINTAGSQALLNKGQGNAGSSIIYNPSSGTWVAVIGNNYMYSKDDGITWIPDSTQNFNINSIQANKDIYIICGFIGSRTVWYSYNFSTITNSDSFPLLGNNANASIYDGSKWIVVGNGGDGKNDIITSADGITWVYNGNGTDTQLTQIFCIAYNASISTPIYLVGGDKGTETMLYSTDCINWVATTNGTSLTQQVYGIGWNGTNQWVVIGVSLDKTGVVMYSSDGMNWIKSISGSDYMNGFITSNSGVALGTVSWIRDSWFVGGCSTTSDIIKSTDGINWTASDNTFNVAGYGCRSIASKTPPVARDYTTVSTLLTDTQYKIYSNKFDSNDVLYYGGNGIIHKFVNNTAIVVAGNGTRGFSGDGGQATSALIGQIRGIDFDSVGNIYFADLTYHVVRKIDIVSGLISTIAGTAGTSGNSGQGGLATSALLNGARDLIFDSNDIMYIVCSGSNVINKIDTNGIITTIAGTGVGGYTNDGGQATSCTMNVPAQISLYKNRFGEYCYKKI